MSHEIYAAVEWSVRQCEKARAKIRPLSDILKDFGKDKPGPILTKGVFDLLHPGHLSLFSYLEELKLSRNASLVVAVASDGDVRRRKGADRPIQLEDSRALQIALLAQVDWVFIYSGDELHSALQSLLPQVYVKGQDTAKATTAYSCQKISIKLLDNPELAGVAQADIGVVVFCDEGDVSTSALIKKIRG